MSTETLEISADDAEVFEAFKRQRAEKAAVELKAWSNTVHRWAERADLDVLRDEINLILAQVGVELLGADNNHHRVRYTVAVNNELGIYGDSRDALVQSARNYITRNNEMGGLHNSSGANGHDVDPETVALEWRKPDGSWVPTGEYFAVVETPTVEVPATLEERKALLRKLALGFYRRHSGKFCADTPQRAFREMGIGEIPPRVTRSVRVPAQATVEVDVAVFEGDDDALVLAEARAALEANQRSRNVGLAAQGTEIEYGEVTVVPSPQARPVDDNDEDDEDDLF